MHCLVLSCSCDVLRRYNSAHMKESQAAQFGGIWMCDLRPLKGALCEGLVQDVDRASLHFMALPQSPAFSLHLLG